LSIRSPSGSLGGERAIDVADASGTLLFDVAGRRWSEPVCEALEIPRDWLPRALESCAVSGETSEGVPVAAGAGNQAAGRRRAHVEPDGDAHSGLAPSAS